jgi:hypothetical protein
VLLIAGEAGKKGGQLSDALDGVLGDAILGSQGPCQGHAKAMPRDEKSQRGGCESLAMLTFAVAQQLCLLNEYNSDLTILILTGGPEPASSKPSTTLSYDDRWGSKVKGQTANILPFAA